MRAKLTNKRYLKPEKISVSVRLVEKSKELGFNISKTFENHLKHLMTQFLTSNSINNFESSANKMRMVGLPGFEPESIEPKSTSLDQASREPHCDAENIISQEP